MGHQRSWLAVGMLVAGAACQHTVVVDSTVPAEVRVDGVPRGPTPTTFTETVGLGELHDVEVSAPGHLMQRRLLRQSESAAGVAVPLLGLGTCTGCMAPVAGIAVVLAVPLDWSVTGIPVAGAAGLGTCVGLLGLGTALVVWAGSSSQQLPDRILFELEPSEGVALPVVPITPLPSGTSNPNGTASDPVTP
jgi:hypothetical protein